MQARIDSLIDLALDEDAPSGDLTSEAIFTPEHRSEARIEAREPLTICGLDIARRVFKRVDPGIEIHTTNEPVSGEDGQQFDRGDVILRVSGPTIGILTAERTALNFLQRLSGIATLSRRFADAAMQAGTGVRIVDTRKTTPAWRALEKHAVRCGGCFNHRSTLSEHVLIKENHIMAAGSIAEAVKRTRALAPHSALIEVETENLDEVRQALAAEAGVIMLDNMTPAMILEAIELIEGRAVIEVSGGVTLDTVKDYALPGVDVISIGALTHSARAADLSMIVEPS